MLKRFQLLLSYYASLLLYFFVFRAIFILYQKEAFADISLEDKLLTFWYALPLDLSFGAYLMAIPVLLVALSTIFAPHIIRPVFKLYNVLIVLFLTILHIADLELYRNWGYRIDNSFFKYLNTPSEMWASSAASPITFLLFLFALSLIPSIYLFNKLSDSHFKQMKPQPFYWSLLYLALLPALIIPIRGGLQLIPINQSVAYFSDQPILNNTALNAPWNFAQSIDASKDTQTNIFQTMPMEEAEEIVDFLYENKQDSTVRYVSGENTNVVLIIWESFTSDVVEALNHRKGITPQFDQLRKEGILVKGMYASASRSEKGTVAIISGYPAQGKLSIMNVPSKSIHLPSLAKSFNKAGYESSYYYGGELEFANLKSYLINAEYQNLIGIDAFHEEDLNSKWGAYDHVLFDKVYQDLKNRKSEQPFFTTLFTLSSHEPFEVPTESAFPGDDEINRFFSSMHYTDASLGDFVRKMKSLPVYENTLFVVTADHGHRLPRQVYNLEPEKYEIPFLLFGGALNKQDTLIEKVCSQTDIAATVLKQIGLDASEFKWSKDLLSPGSKEFAVSSMNTGFLWMDSLGSICYDYQGKQLMYNSHPQADSVLQLGKAHLQLSFQDYLNK